jgi:hypothetical protein
MRKREWFVLFYIAAILGLLVCPVVPVVAQMGEEDMTVTGGQTGGQTGCEEITGMESETTVQSPSLEYPQVQVQPSEGEMTTTTEGGSEDY